METIELTILFNTPVFARGGSDDFEITPQSIKGILRFWYRALLPNVINIHKCGKSEKEYSGMKRAEELIFGSTQRRSVFDVEVDVKGVKQDFGSWIVNPKGRPMFNPKDFPSTSGANYAAYGLSPSKKGDTIRKFLPQGSSATFTFVFRKKSLTEQMQDFFLPLWGIVSMFGGIGAKSRKGYGSFDIAEVKVNGNKNPFDPKSSLFPKNISEILSVTTPPLKNLLSALDIENTLVFNPEKTPFVPDFPVLTSNCWHYKKCFPGTDWKGVLDDIYGKGIMGKRSYEGTFKIYRSVKIRKMRLLNTEARDGVKAVRRIIFDKSSEDAYKDWMVAPSIFGLPLLYQNIGDTDDSVGFGLGEVNNPTGRKASPLFLSIHKKGDKIFAFFLLIPSKISNERNQENKPILTVKPNPSKAGKFVVLGNEDFEGLARILESELAESAAKGGGKP